MGPPNREHSLDQSSPVQSSPVYKARSGLNPRSALRHADVLREIVEARDGRLELQVDGARGAMALLADDHLGLAMGGFHLALPLDVLVGAGPRLLVAQVIFLSIDEEHDVGVLLDRSGFAQVGELR